MHKQHNPDSTWDLLCGCEAGVPPYLAIYLEAPGHVDKIVRAVRGRQEVPEAVSPAAMSDKVKNMRTCVGMLGKDAVHACVMLATLTYRQVRSGSPPPRVGSRVVRGPFGPSSTPYETPGDKVR